jgi:hypothetical protein
MRAQLSSSAPGSASPTIRVVSNSHLADTKEPETSAATQRSDLDKFIDNLDEMLLPDLAREIEEESVLDTISTRAAPGLLGSNPIRSGAEHTHAI